MESKELNPIDSSTEIKEKICLALQEGDIQYYSLSDSDNRYLTLGIKLDRINFLKILDKYKKENEEDYNVDDFILLLEKLGYYVGQIHIEDVYF